MFIGATRKRRPRNSNSQNSPKSAHALAGQVSAQTIQANDWARVALQSLLSLGKLEINARPDLMLSLEDRKDQGQHSCLGHLSFQSVHQLKVLFLKVAALESLPDLIEGQSFCIGHSLTRLC